MCDIPNVKGLKTKYMTQFSSKTFYHTLLLSPCKTTEEALSLFHKVAESWRRIRMNPQMDKLVRRTTIVATITASYFLLTADYGSEPNVLDPIKKAIKSAESSAKDYIFGSKTQPPESKVKNLGTNSAKDHP